MARTHAKGEVQEVSFRPAEGGLVSETHTKFKRSGQGGGPDFDHERETAIHPTIEHAHDHLSAMLGHHFGTEKKAAKPEDGKDGE
jgi:hypothetical protein